MNLRKKTLALLLGSTALATSISFDVVAYGELFSMEPALMEISPSHSKLHNSFYGHNIDMRDLLKDLKGSKTAPSKVMSDLASNWVHLETPAEMVAKVASNPLVMLDEDGHKTVNAHFTHHKATLLEMNALSYAISKRQSASDQMNRWIAALNSNAKDHTDFLAELEEDFFGCMDMLDIFEEMDYQDRRSYLNREISKLETYIKEQVSAEQTLATVLYKSGWELKAFEGKSGYKRALGNPGKDWVNDDRGFVAFHRETNTISVLYHGSRDGSDWAANFDARQVHARSAGLNLPQDVKVHRGFANLVESCKDNVHHLVEQFHNSIAQDKKAKTQIYVSGHSLGAALASISTLELVHNLGSKLFGDTFENAKSNNFKGFYLSAPRAFGKDGVTEANKAVGYDNMMRQNVHGDPVPVAGLKKVEAKLQNFLEWVQGDRKRGSTGVSRIPLMGKWLEKNMFDVLEKPQFKVFLENKLEDALASVSGYRSVGHLALDNTGGTLKRMLWPAAKAFVSRTASNFVGMVKGYWGALVGNNAPNPGVTGFVGNTVSDAVATVVAPLHYGTTLAAEGGGFDKNLPSLETDQLLKQGQSHLESKKAIRQAQPEKKSFWGRTKSKVSGWFGY